MIESFILPDLGEGVHEAEILAIPVEVGQQIAEGDVILELETDKATVEIPSPYTGTITEILIQEGEYVKVGSALMRFEVGDASATSLSPAETAGEQKKESDIPQRKTSGPVPASPATRRLARELDVDLALVEPTGSGGVVTGDDVKNFAKSQKTESLPEAQPPSVSTENLSPVTVLNLPDFSQWGPIEREPLHSIRRATAIQMVTSWSQIPHVNCQDTIDITKLEEFRQRHKEEIRVAGGRLTLTLFALKAAATALKMHPHFNASLDLASQEIIIKNYYHIGVAIDTEHGLVVPVIRDVDRKSIKELAVELHDLVGRARQRNLKREEMQGATFTITNTGALGGSFFSPIINYPEVAILGLGEGRMQATVMTDENGSHEITPRLIMPICLCFDHRVVDGADAIRFLKVIIEALQDPDELLITMI